MKKIFFLISIISIFFLSSCQPKVSQEDAQQIAINFVNERVKFTVNDNETGIQLVQRANNRITNIYNENKMWYVEIFVESVIEDQAKTALFTVVIDDNSGQVLDLVKK